MFAMVLSALFLMCCADYWIATLPIYQCAYRYVLLPPEECQKLKLHPRGHPSARHSSVAWHSMSEVSHHTAQSNPLLLIRVLVFFLMCICFVCLFIVEEAPRFIQRQSNGGGLTYG